MAQFDVYENTNPKTRNQIPYFLDVQTDQLDSLVTRVVIPLFTAAAFTRPAQRLNPVVTVGNARFVMSTAELAGVPVKILGSTVCSLRDIRQEIIAALDFLITGV